MTLQTSRLKSVIGRLAFCLLAVSIIFSFSACEQSEKTKQALDKRGNEAQQALNSTQTVPHALSYDPLVVTDKLWNGNEAVRMQRGIPLPSRYEDTRGITLVSSEPMSLSDLANALSAQTGIPVRLSSVSATTVPSSVPSSSSSSSSPSMPISYEGSLSGLLERMSAFFGISWRYDGSAITISRYETRIFVIEALPGSQELNEGMQDDTSGGGGGSSSSGSSGSSGGGGSSSSSGSSSTNTLTQNSKTTMTLKYWDELATVIKSIVGSQGSATISPTMGTVTVTTTPDVMETIADYIAKENKRLSRQIAINVQIYSVNLAQSEDFNLAFSAVLDNLSKFHIPNLGFTSAAAPGIANPTLTSSSLGSLSVAIIRGNATASDLFQALSSIGNTSTVAQFPMTTLNNHPISRRVGTDTTYISSVTQTSTTTTSTENQFTPVTSTIHDGFSLQLTPRLLDDGRILLQYSLSLIGLDSLNPTSFAGVPLDLPVTNNRLFVQQSMLRSGETLLIGGVDQENLTQNQNGVGSPNNFLLGGGISTQSVHFMLFMSLTPQVMDSGNEEHN